jgi:hypothetical protein
MRRIITRSHASDIYNIKFRRAGIIPYIKVGGINHYSLFVDSTFHEITEAAGGVHKGEHFIDGAIRECLEESMGLFDFTNFRELLLKECLCYSTDKCVIIFVQIKGSKSTMSHLAHEFRRIYESRIVNIIKGNYVCKDLIENSFMTWISESQLRNLTFPTVGVLPKTVLDGDLYSKSNITPFHHRCLLTELLKVRCVSILEGKSISNVRHKTIFSKHFDERNDFSKDIKLFNVTKFILKLIYFDYGNLAS